MFQAVVNELAAFIALSEGNGCSADSALNCISNHILPEYNLGTNSDICCSIFEALSNRDDIVVLPEKMFVAEKIYSDAGMRRQVFFQPSEHLRHKMVGLQGFYTDCEKQIVLFLCSHIEKGFLKSDLSLKFGKMHRYHAALRLLQAKRVVDIVHVFNPQTLVFDEMMFLYVVSPRQLSKTNAAVRPALRYFEHQRQGLLMFEHLKPFFYEVLASVHPRMWMQRAKVLKRLAEKLDIEVVCKTLRSQVTTLLPLIGLQSSKRAHGRSLQCIFSFADHNFSGNDDGAPAAEEECDETGTFYGDPRIPLVLQMVDEGTRRAVDGSHMKPNVAIDDKDFMRQVRLIVDRTPGVEVTSRRMKFGKAFTLCLKPLSAAGMELDGGESKNGWGMDEVLKALSASPDGMVTVNALYKILDRKNVVQVVMKLRAMGRVVTTGYQLKGRPRVGIVALNSAILSDEIKEKTLLEFLHGHKQELQLRRQITMQDRVKCESESGDDLPVDKVEAKRYHEAQKSSAVSKSRTTKACGKLYAVCNGYCEDDKQRQWRLHLELWNLYFRNHQRHRFPIQEILAEMSVGTYCVCVGFMDALPSKLLEGIFSWATPMRLLIPTIKWNLEHSLNQLRHLVRLLSMSGVVRTNSTDPMEHVELLYKTQFTGGEELSFVGSDLCPSPSTVLGTVSNFWRGKVKESRDTSTIARRYLEDVVAVKPRLEFHQILALHKVFRINASNICRYFYTLKTRPLQREQLLSISEAVESPRLVNSKRHRTGRIKKSNHMDITRKSVFQFVYRLAHTSRESNRVDVGLSRLVTIIQRATARSDPFIVKEREQLAAIIELLRSIVLKQHETTEGTVKLLCELLSPNFSCVGQDQGEGLKHSTTPELPTESDDASNSDLAALLRLIVFSDKSHRDELNMMKKLSAYPINAVVECAAKLRARNQFSREKSGAALPVKLRPTRNNLLPHAYGVDDLNTCSVVPHAHSLTSSCGGMNLITAESPLPWFDIFDRTPSDPVALVKMKTLGVCGIPYVVAHNIGMRHARNQSIEPPPVGAESRTTYPFRYATLHGAKYAHNLSLANIPVDTTAASPSVQPDFLAVQHQDGCFHNFAFRTLLALLHSAVLQKPGILHSSLRSVLSVEVVSDTGLSHLIEYLCDSRALRRRWMRSRVSSGCPFLPLGMKRARDEAVEPCSKGEWCYEVVPQATSPCDILNV